MNKFLGELYNNVCVLFVVVVVYNVSTRSLACLVDEVEDMSCIQTETMSIRRKRPMVVHEMVIVQKASR